MEDNTAFHSSWSEGDKGAVGAACIDIIESKTGILKTHRPEGSRAYVVGFTEEAVALMGRLGPPTPKYRPMVVLPHNWMTDQDGGDFSSGGGYLLAQELDIKIMRTPPRYKERLNAFTPTSSPKVVNAINGLQRVAWRLNTHMLNTIEYVWRTERNRDNLFPDNKPQVESLLNNAWLFVDEASIFLPAWADWRAASSRSLSSRAWATSS